MNGRDPYLIYHDLDDGYVPRDGGERMPPPYPSRLQAVMFAMGQYEFEFLARLAGAKLPGDERQRPAREERA